MQGMQFTEPSSMKVTFASASPRCDGTASLGAGLAQSTSANKKKRIIGIHFILGPHSLCSIFGNIANILGFVKARKLTAAAIEHHRSSALDHIEYFWQNSQITKEEARI
jgi:hypothetical protein